MAHPLQKQTAKRRLSIRKEYQEVNRIRSGFERSLAFRFIRLFSEIGERTATAFEANGTQGADIVLNRIRPDVESTLISFYREVIQTFTERAVRQRSLKATARGFEEIYADFVNKVGANHISDIDDTTRKQVRKVILDNQGAGTQVIGKAIRERMSPQFTRRRATMIARTETHSAASYATHEQYKAFDAPDMVKQWVANNDERTRPAHFAVSGQQVGMDEAFIVGGKRMQFPGDPAGGASEVINCRCQVIYVEPDVELIDQPQTAEPPLQNVVKPRATAETLLILKKAVARKEIQASLVVANRDYGEAETISQYGRRKVSDYGKISNANALSDEALSAVKVINEELNDIAKICNVPPIRGYKNIRKGSNAMANQGDGVMGIQTAMFNDMAKTIKAKKLTDVERQRLEDERRKLVTEDIEKTEELRSLTDEGSRQVYELPNADQDRAYSLRDEIIALRKSRDSIDEALRADSSTKLRPSEWQFGDDLKKRPWVSSEYYDNNLDRIRSTMYHEFGHQVHQLFDVQGNAARYRLRPLERYIETKFAKTVERKTATKYGMENPAEWFAENFSLYFMNKRHLVDPRFTEVIEKVMRNETMSAQNWP
jgi:SPP1 gp7 family putative phage head morphogenesis protein